MDCASSSMCARSRGQPPCLRYDDEPAALLLAVPGSFNVGQWHAFGFDPKLALCHAIEKLPDRFHPDIGQRRCAAGPRAENFEARTAQGSGRKRDRRSSTLADLDQSGSARGRSHVLTRDGGKEGFGRLTPDVVDDHVKSLVARFANKSIPKALTGLVERNGRVRAEIAKRPEDLRVPAGRYDTSGAQKFSSLNRQLSRHACAAKNQNCLPGRKLGAPDKRAPGGESWIHDRSSRIVIDSRRQGKAPWPGHDCVLSHRSVGCARHREEYPGAVRENARSIGSADRRELAKAGIVRAARHLLVDWLQCSRADFNQNLALADDGIGKCLTARGLTQGMQDRSIHLVDSELLSGRILRFNGNGQVKRLLRDRRLVAHGLPMSAAAHPDPGIAIRTTEVFPKLMAFHIGAGGYDGGIAIEPYHHVAYIN